MRRRKAPWRMVDSERYGAQVRMPRALDHQPPNDVVRDNGEHGSLGDWLGCTVPLAHDRIALHCMQIKERQVIDVAELYHNVATQPG